MYFSGTVSGDMIEQAQQLVKRMKQMEDINMEKDWKIVTLMIGGNDICDYCNDPRVYSVSNYTNNIEAALDVLYEELPRTFVNLVPYLDISPLEDYSSDIICGIVHWMVCPCIMKPEWHHTVKHLSRQYSDAIENMVAGGKYDDRSDFTVVFQPFTRDSLLPRTANGSEDMSYFAPDCFHLSQKGHNAFSKSLWNSMYGSVGKKSVSANWEDAMYCPQKDEYFKTWRNSNLTEEMKTNMNNSVSSFSGSSIVIILAVVLVVVIIIYSLCLTFFLKKSGRSAQNPSEVTENTSLINNSYSAVKQPKSKCIDLQNNV